MIYLVDTFGGGPVADIHVVYIRLSDELGDLSIHDLSGRSDGDGELLSLRIRPSHSRRCAKAPQRYFYTMDVGY